MASLRLEIDSRGAGRGLGTVAVRIGLAAGTGSVGKTTGASIVMPAVEGGCGTLAASSAQR